MCRWWSLQTSVGAALVACAATAAIADHPARYDGDRVVRIAVADEAQLETVLNLTDDVWSHEFGAPGAIDVRLSSAQFAALDGLGLPFEVMIEDVQAVLEAQLVPAGRGTFDQFLNFTQVRDHLAALETAHPTIAQRVVIGQSIENRPLEMLRITGPGDSSQRPVVWLQGCQHAREWIAVMVPLYIADRLVNSYDTDAGIRALLDRAVVCVLPVVNPDGYEFTWTSFRMWRKNMRQNDDGSLGVDLNRNWGVGWGGVGSSTFGFAENYQGTAPYSEPEVSAVRTYLTQQSRVAFVVDFHSYSQIMLWSWSDRAARSPLNERLTNVLRVAARHIIEVFNMAYLFEQGFHAPINQASGVVIDFAVGELGAPSVTIELRDRGVFAFLLPPEQILPNCEEIWPGVLHIIRETTSPVRIEPAPTPPQFAEANMPTRVVVQARAEQAGTSVATVALEYRIADGALETRPMAPDGCEECYAATVPAAPCGTNVRMRIVATRSDGATAYWPDPSIADEAVIPVRVSRVVTSADFNASTAGWIVSGTTAQGRWVRDVPRATFTANGQAEPGGGYPLGSGGACWVTGVSINDNPEQTDVDGGPTELASALINLTGLNDPIARFANWTYSDGDEVLVMSIAGGTPTMKPVPSLPALGRWALADIRLRDWVGSSTSARLGFQISGMTTTAVTEAAIDDFQLLDLSCPPLLGDMNCDAFVTVADIGGFVLALTDPGQYALSYPACDIALADVNGDTFVTVAAIGGFAGLVTA